MATEENTLSNEKENKINSNEQEENKNQEQNINKDENNEKDENQQKKEKNLEIDDNELDNMKYEILNEDCQEFDLSFKIIVIGDSGK